MKSIPWHPVASPNTQRGIQLSAQVKGILETLVDVLRTPSAEVQKAVAACMPPLMPLLRSDRPYLTDLIKRLLDRLLKGKSYGDRRAAPSQALQPGFHACDMQLHCLSPMQC